MRAIMVMFDSLNRHMLESYGCEWTQTPNFKRLAEGSVLFENCYVGSMPCMPARREMHTGRYNFLHRSWGPIEPFDDSMPQILKDNGVYSHLISDHQHYWEDGGCNYHTRYSSWEISRGQEGDPWKGYVGRIDIPDGLKDQRKLLYRQDQINRRYIEDETQYPQAKTFSKGLAFIDENHSQDDWFLQIETFDPHEPFYSTERFKKLYPNISDDFELDWPDYERVLQAREEIEHCRNEYAALLSMCDYYLGQVLDVMDKYELWEDTMLIVNTDHGFLLGEHDWWGKCAMPWFNEIAKVPLFIWDPRSNIKGERRKSLVQTIDLPATILEYFNLPIPHDMQGKSLCQTIECDTPVRSEALYGIFGGHVNCTDGRYVYMRGAQNSDNKPLYQYTLMPTHMRKMFSLDEIKTAKLVKGFQFTKGTSVMKVEAGIWDNRDVYSMSGYCGAQSKYSSFLYDLEHDPEQKHPIYDKNIEEKMIKKMMRLMMENDSPSEQFERLGLSSI